MALSSVQSIAGSGLLPNPPASVGTALAVNSDLTGNITVYQGLPVIAALTPVFDACAANAANALANLRSMGTSDSPFMVDSLPVGLTATDVYPAPDYSAPEFYQTLNQVISGNSVYQATQATTGNAPPNPTYWTEVWPSTGFFTDLVTLAANRIMGSGDITRFCSLFASALGYVAQSNAVLEANKASETLASTFDPAKGGMDSLSTGGLNQFSNDLQAVAADMQKLGDLINLRVLDDWGLPGQLLAQIGLQTGGEIPAVSSLMRSAGIASSTIRELSFGNNNLTNDEERLLYQIMLGIDGEDLEQVLAILRVTTLNITNMAQLLDPRRIFPNSYSTLLCPTADGLLPVYVGDSANRNLLPLFEADPVSAFTGPNNANSYDTLSKIIPPDQALANKALTRSLQQIKNITESTLPGLSTAMSSIETNAGLGDINSLTQPVPADVQDFYVAALGEGTGPDGTFLLTDVVGLPTGINYVDYFNTVITNINTVDSASSFATLTGTSGVYTVMLTTLATNTYVQDDGFGNVQIVIPGGLPGAGTYPPTAVAPGNVNLAREAAMTGNGSGIGLVAAGNAALTTLGTTYATEWGLMLQAWQDIGSSMDREKNNLASAEIDINQLGLSRSSAMAFAENLHQWGTDTADGGPNQCLEKLATDTLSGQAVLSSLREGRNIKNLESAGISMDTQLG